MHSDYNNLTFFDPITEQELNEIKNKTGVEISGDLLELLQQTNGISENVTGSLIFTSNQIIEYYKEHLDFLKETENIPLYELLFFSGNGCGENFCFIVKDGKFITKEIGIYYPMENEYRIVAPDLMTWAKDWLSGELKT